jgi:hypothetical protein
MMRSNLGNASAALLQKVEHSIRQTTHGRIRDLAVEEVQGRYVVRGRVPSYHTKQLALYAALELLPSDRFDMNILVS